MSLSRAQSSTTDQESTQEQFDAIADALLPQGISLRRPDGAPWRRGVRALGIARRQKNLQLVGRKRLGRRGAGTIGRWSADRPPAKLAAG